jgi:uncharacterized protein YcbX
LSERVGRVAELARYPVKSMAGERLAEARFGPTGIDGDRRWAIYTADGGIASGKTTRRFRRVDGLFGLLARLNAPAEPAGPDDWPRSASSSREGSRPQGSTSSGYNASAESSGLPGFGFSPESGVPTVWLPDGRQFRADEPAASAALSALLGQPLELRQESAVCHHDESRVHVITTAAVRQLELLIGEPVEITRFRANVVLEIDGTGFIDDGWRGGTLALGNEVQLSLGEGMPRCAMVGLPQPHAGLPADARLLKELGRIHNVRFGLKADVIQGGTVRPGDGVLLR